MADTTTDSSITNTISPYIRAAERTAAGNLAGAQTATAANRVNQYTPYGNLVYTQTGTDANGNPMWSATQTLSPDQQALYNYDIATSKGLGELSGKGLSYVSNMLQTPFDTSRLPSTGFNPSETYQEAYMRRLAPQIQMNREQLQQQLANQGIDIGSKAYENAMRMQTQKENDLLLGATTQGFGVGQTARGQALQEAAYLRNEPLNTLNAVRSGAQVQGPSFVNAPQQVATAGPDYLGAANALYSNQMAGYNAQLANQSNMMGGLMNLGGQLGSAYMLMP